MDFTEWLDYVTFGSSPGLPDFSWHNLPKRGQIYQITSTLPNGHKIHIPNDRKIFQMDIT
jgi:hypothetical protein